MPLVIPGLVPSPIPPPSIPGVNPVSPVAPPITPAPPPGNLPPAAPETQRFRVARRNFTSFAKAGGSGGSKQLRRALSSYVSKGSGGIKGATARMGPSQKVATQIGGFIRSLERSGTAEALKQINCGDLAGKPAAEALNQLVDSFCPEGGPVDESVARQAFQETVADWADKDLPAIENLSSDQWKDLLVDFMARSIEIKIFADIGTSGIAIPTDAQQALNLQQDLHGVIEGAVRGAFNDRDTGFNQLKDNEISNLMESVYESAWGFLESEGGDK